MATTTAFLKTPGTLTSQSIATSTTASTPILLISRDENLLLGNNSTGWCFIHTSATGTSAAVTQPGTPDGNIAIAPGAQVVLGFNANDVYISAILTTSTGFLYITQGQGL